MDWPKPICQQCKQPIETPRQALLQTQIRPETFWHIDCYSGAVGNMLGIVSTHSTKITAGATVASGMVGGATMRHSLEKTKKELGAELNTGNRAILQKRITTTNLQGLFCLCLLPLSALFLLNPKNQNMRATEYIGQMMAKFMTEPIWWLTYLPAAVGVVVIGIYLSRLSRFEKTYIKRD